MTDKTLMELVKDSPIVAVAGMTFMGVSLSDWILILTLLYAVVRLVSAGIDLWSKIKEKFNGRKQ